MPTDDELDVLADHIDQTLEHGAPAQRKALIEALVEEIQIVGPSQIRAVYRIPCHIEGDPAAEDGTTVGTMGNLVEVLRRYSKLTAPPDPDRFIIKHNKPDQQLLPPAHCVTRRLGPDGVTGLLQRYQDGATLSRLAADYHLHRASIRKLLRQHSVELRRHSLTDAEVEQAAHLYATGLTVAQVADQLGRHHSTVQVALRRHGVQMRSRHDYD